eukprot:scaffold7335_cov417-Prasinococcus_capsulatus_cf.AAC.18
MQFGAHLLHDLQEKLAAHQAVHLGRGHVVLRPRDLVDLHHTPCRVCEEGHEFLVVLLLERVASAVFLTSRHRACRELAFVCHPVQEAQRCTRQAVALSSVARRPAGAVLEKHVAGAWIHALHSRNEALHRPPVAFHRLQPPRLGPRRRRGGWPGPRAVAHRADAVRHHGGLRRVVALVARPGAYRGLKVRQPQVARRRWHGGARVA